MDQFLGPNKNMQKARSLHFGCEVAIKVIKKTNLKEEKQYEIE